MAGAPSASDHSGLPPLASLYRERAVIPNHVLNASTPSECLAIRSRGGEIHLLVHPPTDDPGAIRGYAAREGSQGLPSHPRAPAAVREVVASRERDVGGEG